MQWVDAMRGFSMIMVVLGHVLMCMKIGGYHSVLSSILLTFRMPLFFFVSGYFSYRLITWWNNDRTLNILKRKIQAQIIGTAIFLSIYNFTFNLPYFNGFGGYWFTIVLFQMYCIYLLSTWVCIWIKRDIIIPILILISCIFLIILVTYNRASAIWNYMCWENLTKYMQFFTLGIICCKYKNQFFDLLEKDWFRTMMISGWVICMILWYSSDFKNFSSALYAFVHDIIVRYFALMTVIIVFFSHKSLFKDESSKGVKLIEFVGRRTLDIYFLHYFFLPNLGFLQEWLSQGNMIVPQIIISGTITIVILGLCLLISNILRKSHILQMWLFGVKNRLQ